MEEVDAAVEGVVFGDGLVDGVYGWEEGAVHGVARLGEEDGWVAEVSEAPQEVVQVERQLRTDVGMTEYVLQGHHQRHHRPTHPQKQQNFADSPHRLNDIPICFVKGLTRSYFLLTVEIIPRNRLRLRVVLECHHFIIHNESLILYR